MWQNCICSFYQNAMLTPDQRLALVRGRPRIYTLVLGAFHFPPEVFECEAAFAAVRGYVMMPSDDPVYLYTDGRALARSDYALSPRRPPGRAVLAERDRLVPRTPLTLVIITVRKPGPRPALTGQLQLPAFRRNDYRRDATNSDARLRP
jgi:hypothetical protein